ncbi:hypothetical protein [Mycobacterium sp.]
MGTACADDLLAPAADDHGATEPAQAIHPNAVAAAGDTAGVITG